MNAEGRGDRDVKNAPEQRADAVAATQDALHVMTERFEAAIQASHVVTSIYEDTRLHIVVAASR
jgi:hypothetical protein